MDKKSLSEKLVRPSLVAEMLSVSRSTIYRWFWNNKLRGVKLTNRTLRIYQSSIDEMCDGREVI
jgi:excisionase family DNA binding protein